MPRGWAEDVDGTRPRSIDIDVNFSSTSNSIGSDQVAPIPVASRCLRSGAVQPLHLDKMVKGATIVAWERGVVQIQASIERQIAALLP